MAAAVKWRLDRLSRPSLMYPLVIEAISGEPHDCQTCSTSDNCEPEHVCCKDHLLRWMVTMGWADKSELGTITLIRGASPYKTKTPVKKRTATSRKRKSVKKEPKEKQGRPSSSKNTSQQSKRKPLPTSNSKEEKPTKKYKRAATDCTSPSTPTRRYCKTQVKQEEQEQEDQYSGSDRSGSEYQPSESSSDFEEATGLDTTKKSCKKKMAFLPSAPSTKQATASDKPLPILAHSKYKEGYWMESDDLSFVAAVMLGREERFAATAYDTLVEGLEEVTKPKGNRSQRAGRRDSRWGKWTTQITNCGSSVSSGIHWVLTSVKFSQPPEAILWEPLSNQQLSRSVVKALIGVCGKANVTIYNTKQQSDGWSCGYLSMWWKLQMFFHGQNFEDNRPFDATPDLPPVGWVHLIWLLLEARDAQNKCTRASAMNIAIAPILIEAMNDHNYDFVGSAMDCILSTLRGLGLKD